MQIIIADVSMSLDNVLAVAGAAQHHPEVLIFGLALSVVLMGVAASLIAGLLNRFRWIAWVGLAIILYVAVKMLYEGADQLLGHTLPMIPFIKGCRRPARGGAAEARFRNQSRHFLSALRRPDFAVDSSARAR